MVEFPRMERAFLAEGFARAKLGSLGVHTWLRNRCGWAVRTWRPYGKGHRGPSQEARCTLTEDRRVVSSRPLQRSRAGAMSAPSLPSGWRGAWTQSVHRACAARERAAWAPRGSQAEACAVRQDCGEREECGSSAPHTGMQPVRQAGPSRISREARHLHHYP